ncbi:MAG: sulfatase-like hydrolase/transferase, partial [Azoarcus sp.]|nr:sulfatase-like hydrolase/transferase [Azoarcus sp.]
MKIDTRTMKRVAGGGLLLVFAAAFVLLVYLRVDRIDALIGPELDCPGCLNRSVFIHDSPYAAGVLFCLLAGFALPFGVGAVFFRAAALVGILFYGLDLAVSWQLSTRLHLGDLLVFVAQPTVLASHMEHTGLVGWSEALAMAAACAAFLFVPWRLPLAPRQVAWLGGVPAALLVAGLVLDPGQYVRDWALLNVAEVNFEDGSSRPYRRIAELEAVPESLTCAPGSGSLGQTRGDLIVLLLESWSPYQSALFGEIRDWTPRLDAIARENQYYSHMVAAGFATHEGLMSMLTGMEFLSPVKSFFDVKPFETSWGQPRTLPRLLASHGYKSAFFTTGNLAFASKNQWLRDVGFYHVEGHDHPFYDGLPRLHFDAAPDEALYARVLDYLDREGDGSPRLIVVENVSSHHPFIHPLTLEHSEEAVFRYMDKTVGDFYDALKARGFLERGNLLIVSDHRAMVPLRPGEQ